MSTTITRDDWVKALSDAGLSSVDDQSALTIYEFAEMMGIHHESAKRRLDKLVKAGKAERVTKRKVCPDGTRIWNYVAYRLTP